MQRFTVRKSHIILTFTLLALMVLMPIITTAQGGGIISGEEEPKNSSQGIFERIRGIFSDVEEVSNQTKEASAQVQQAVESSGFKEILIKIWEGIKAFFADKGARDLLIDTVKLFLRLIVNIFLLIAGVIQKVMQSVGWS